MKFVGFTAGVANKKPVKEHAIGMKEHDVAIIGAGPAGLSCAYFLAKAGMDVLVIEQASVAGGLMRSVEYEDYCVDLGRKELYSRIPLVNSFWSELLGDDYLPYDHRVGFLFNDQTLEESSKYRGMSRGMSFGLIMKGLPSLISCKLKRKLPTNLAEQASTRYGAFFSIIFARGFEEKFKGSNWHEEPVRKVSCELSQTNTTTMASPPVKVDRWLHPRYGAGQITNAIKQYLGERELPILTDSELVDIDVVGQRIEAITYRNQGELTKVRARQFVSSVPLSVLSAALGTDSVSGANAEKHLPPDDTKHSRGTIVVYLFIDDASRFPHSWINVSDPTLKLGRIVNYTNFGGDMVPAGKTCLCCEFFLSSDDELFNTADDEIVNLILLETINADLFEADSIEHHLVIKLPGVNAAGNWRSFVKDERSANLFGELQALINLYNISRAGTDRAAHAGIVAAQAIIDDNRKCFLDITDPSAPAPWQD